MRHQILVVEDDENLGPSLKGLLEGEGYRVELSSSLEKAREQLAQKWDLLVLDWNLPDGQGVDLLKEIRKQDLRTPVIMLTARTELIDKVIGLESGANDYLTKPFEPRELVARARVQLRSRWGSEIPEEPTTIKMGDILINTAERVVKKEGVEIEMTKMEFDLLRLFADSPNRAFSREEILNKVWGFDNYPTTRTVDTHILQLRQKLGEALFETVRGVGYRLRFP
jgi:DNA-binding response OmpR family regulator